MTEYTGRFDGSQAKHASPAMAAVSQAAGQAVDVSNSATSTKWSVLSSRVEGLVAELGQVVGGMDAYCVSQSNSEGPGMKVVREKMLATNWAAEWEAKKTMFSYGEEMSTDPLEAMMLKHLVHLGQPRRILEIGMFVGFGAVAMLEGAPKAEVVSLEIDPYLPKWLSSCLADFPQLTSRHKIMLGAALDSLPKVEGTFDFVFVDANKAEYKSYVEVILKRGLLSPQGVIVCDNILYNGYPYVPNHFDAQPARRGFGDAVREFNQWICDHPALEQIVLPIRDGVSMVRLKPATFAPPPRVQDERIRLFHQSGGSCEISRYGGHILSWCSESGREEIFLGSKAVVGEPGVAIRGGVPVCWPQFGPFMQAAGAPGLKHGFVRTSNCWTVAEKTQDSVTLAFVPDAETKAKWPMDYEFTFTVALGSSSLRMIMEVTNKGKAPLEFTGCLHTYFGCDRSDTCAVEGLKGGKYDKSIGDCFRGDAVEERDAVPFTDEKETQLMYGNATDTVFVTKAGKRKLRLTKSNMPDWIVWNTGGENGSGIKDLAELEYRKYICVEPGFASSPIRVAPGAAWVGSHEVKAL